MNEHIQTLTEDAMKAAPPVTVSVLTLGGVELSQWLIVLTIIYTLLQIYVTLRKALKPVGDA